MTGLRLFVHGWDTACEARLSAMSAEQGSLAGALAGFLQLRRRLERAVGAGATSVDGRVFSYEAPVGSELVPPGGFVALVDGERRALGQILDQQLVLRPGPVAAVTLNEEGLGSEEGLSMNANVRLRVIEGGGRILAGDGRAFVDAALLPATADEVSAFFARAGSDAVRLEIGKLALVEGEVTASLDAAGFDRHTFLCGQSGSGKTYSLGVVLERLLMDTSLRVVVIDPNSDFVRLREPRQGADPGLAARLAELAPSLRVRRPTLEHVDERLRFRLAELDGAAIGGVLRLDPVADGEEYAVLREALDDQSAAAAIDRLERASQGPPEAQRLVRRIRNLGIDSWPVWARDQAGSLLDELVEGDWRCLVVDIGLLETPAEKALVAQAVLGRLWERRNDRRPVLIVVDEAHNVCPQLPEGPLQALATDYAIRIAAEGRKFGLHLLVSTQRPQKVHENVVSQCDNLLLMRMNSAADVSTLNELFSFVPPSLLERTTDLLQGEALVAGKLVPTPTFVRFGARVSEEGGSDVAADWART